MITTISEAFARRFETEIDMGVFLAQQARQFGAHRIKAFNAGNIESAPIELDAQVNEASQHSSIVLRCDPETLHDQGFDAGLGE